MTNSTVKTSKTAASRQLALQSRQLALQTPPAPRPADSKECKCPLESEHKGKRLFHTERLPTSAQDAYKLAFLQEEFMSDVLDSRKCTNYTASAWSQHPELQVSQRTVRYNCPVPFTTKTSAVCDTQTLATESRTGEVYVVNSEVKNEGIPLADSFIISVHVCIARAPPPENCADYTDDVTQWCTYSCYAIITYKKSVWGIIKGQLERSVYSGMEGIHRDVAAALRDSAEGSHPPSEDAQRSNRSPNARKKRKSKMGSYDSYKKTREDNQGSGWSHFFLNSMYLLSALLLVMVNVSLFRKVQTLEAVSRNLTMDKSCPPSYTGKLTTNEFGIPLNQESDGAWALVKSLLASQRAAYSSELQQMGNHLLQASNALDQADSELHLVLDRLPYSLDVLEDVAREHVRNEHLVGHINELLRRSELQEQETEPPFDVDIRVAKSGH